jgi:hypothetical protein
MALTIIAPEAANGQFGKLQQQLAGATRLECRFSAVSKGDWDGTTPVASVEPAEFETSFSNVNIEEGTAEADGRFGSSYIVVRYTNDYLHLVQMIDIGPLYVTTVLARESRPGRLMAVQTRHKYAPSSYPEFVEHPEMFIGDCGVGD